MMKNPVLVGAILGCLGVGGIVSAQAVFTKGQVADRIKKVEDGVDEFRKWAENRAEQGQSGAQTAKASGRTRGRTATESQKDVAKDKKDELDNALGDLNRSTNRLRRKFDPTDKWMETRPQVETVLDDARKINQVMARGKYGTQAERYWGVLRTAINDLARSYNLHTFGCVGGFVGGGTTISRHASVFRSALARHLCARCLPRRKHPGLVANAVASRTRRAPGNRGSRFPLPRARAERRNRPLTGARQSV